MSIGLIPPAPLSGLVLLEQHTASASASLDFTTCISSTYDEYQIEFVNVVPETDAVDLWMRMSTDGGSTYDSGSNYFFSGFGFNNTGSSVLGVGSAAKTTAIKFQNAANIDNSADYGVVGSGRLFSPGSSSLRKYFQYRVTYLDNTAAVLQNLDGTGIYDSATAVNAFQFLMSSGNIASGTIRVYGVGK